MSKIIREGKMRRQREKNNVSTWRNRLRLKIRKKKKPNPRNWLMR
jgi:hypothetical protein